MRRWLLSEGAIVAVAGALLGALIGIGYAWLMITGLRTWWVAAITAPFLALHVVPLTLVIGSLIGGRDRLSGHFLGSRTLEAVERPFAAGR